LTTAFILEYISYNECYPSRIQSVENGEKLSSASTTKVGRSFCRFYRYPQLLGWVYVDLLLRISTKTENKCEKYR